MASGCGCGRAPAVLSSLHGAARAAPSSLPDRVLAERYRLRRSTEFTATVRGGRRSGRHYLVVHLAVSPSGLVAAPGPPRAGFVVSKAVGGAVVRNAVTRRLRALVHDRLDAMPPGSSMVVRALPAAASASYAELGADLDACLARLLRPEQVRL